jgi:hypothetical protein
MNLSDLPTAVRTFLKATGTHDADALFGSLANDAVLIDSDHGSEDNHDY